MFTTLCLNWEGQELRIKYTLKRHERLKVKSHRHRESLLILLYHIFKEFKAVHIHSEHHFLEEFLLNSSYTGNLNGSLEQRLALDPLI